MNSQLYETSIRIQPVVNDIFDVCKYIWLLTKV